MYDIFERNNRSIQPFKQITKLNNYNNCLIYGDLCGISTLTIWFDQIYDIVPSKMEFYNGKNVVYYNDVKIVKIVSDESLHNTYDENNVLLMLYSSDYVKNNYSNLIDKTSTISSLIGKYIIDWKSNKKLITELKNNSSEYIELNYYVFN